MSTPVELQALSTVSTSTLATLLHEHGFRQQVLVGLQSFGGRTRFVGYAFTMRMVPSRADLVEDKGRDRFRESLDDLPPDHVMVVDSRGDTRAACFGGLMITRLEVRGVAAVVTDGSIRDSAQLATKQVCVRAAGVSATTRAAFLQLAGIQETIACAGVTVVPDDVLVGDEDGVVVLPRVLAAEIGRLAHEREELEEFAYQRICAGSRLRGTYPADSATLRLFEEWKSSGRSAVDNGAEVAQAKMVRDPHVSLLGGGDAESGPR